MESLFDPGALPRGFGPFLLIHPIARGGFGEVYLALRPIPGEPVDEICVVKMVRQDLRNDDEIVGRFLDESRIMQLLDHPAICATLDAGVVGDSAYLALEFVSGRTLRAVDARVQEQGRAIVPPLAVHIVGEVLDALHHAHTLTEPGTGRPTPVVHRDISPHNILIGFDGGVKLIDFGLSLHRLRKEVTQADVVVGKVRYAAPEYLRDERIDARSDLFAVGIILYELVTGTRYYEGLADEDIWRTWAAGSHRPAQWDSLHPQLAAIIARSLTAKPADRFASARAMGDAIRALGPAFQAANPRALAARMMASAFRSELEAERALIAGALNRAHERTREFIVPVVTDPTTDPPAQAIGRALAASPTVVRTRLTNLIGASDEGEVLVLARAAFEAPPAVTSSPSNSGVFKDGRRVPDPDDTTGVLPGTVPAARAARAASFAEVVTEPERAAAQLPPLAASDAPRSTPKTAPTDTAVTDPSLSWDREAPTLVAARKAQPQRATDADAKNRAKDAPSAEDVRERRMLFALTAALGVALVVILILLVLLFL